MQTTEQTQAICGPYTQIEANQTGPRGLSAGTAACPTKSKSIERDSSDLRAFGK